MAVQLCDSNPTIALDTLSGYQGKKENDKGIWKDVKQDKSEQQHMYNNHSSKLIVQVTRVEVRVL